MERVWEVIYFKYIRDKDRERYYFITKHIAKVLYNKYLKLIFPDWIEDRLKELEKLYIFHRYKNYLIKRRSQK